MSDSKPVLLLFTQVFANGGIQRFNRTFLAACERLGTQCDAYCLEDDEPAVSRHPPHTAVSVRTFAKDKIRFVLAVARAIWFGRYRTVVIGHVNVMVLVAALRVLRPFGGPRLLLIAHGIDVWSGIGGWRRWALQVVQRILCVSEYTKQMMEAQAPELAADRFTIFPNALSESWIAHRESMMPAVRRPALPERFILSVTRLDHDDRTKGVITTMETLSMLEDSGVHYVIAGRGDDMDFLAATARRFNVADRVHFLGAVTDEELVDLYRNCMAFVLPTGQEGFGIVFLEAMFFNAPIIAAGAKGVLDVVHDGYSGLLVPYGDVVSLRRAIETLLPDAALRGRLVAQARATVVGDGAFTFGAFVNRCASVLGVASPPEAAKTATSSNQGSVGDLRSAAERAS